MTHKITVLPGDGIGPEIVAETLKVLDCLREDFGLQAETEEALIGGAAYDVTGSPFPAETLALCQQADSILLGAVGGPKWEPLDYSVRPERGLLGLRSELTLFANLRPAICYPALADAYDTMTTGGYGRKALPPEETRNAIVAGSGSEFDSEVVRAFTKAFNRLEMELPAIIL